MTKIISLAFSLCVNALNIVQSKLFSNNKESYNLGDPNSMAERNGF